MNTTTQAPTGQTTLDFTAPLNATTGTDRPTREDRLAAAHAVLAAGLADVRDDPEALARYLAFRSKFYDYSLNNTLLIFAQNPAARYVKGYRAWQAVGRQVRKGERGLTILAPVIRRATKAEVAAGPDPDTPSVVSFRTATVFDLAQTDPIDDGALVYVPPAPRLDADDPEGLTARLEAVARSLGFEVVYLDTGYADGRCSFALRTISVQGSLSPADRAAVLCPALAHALAHEGVRELTTAQRELQAEGAAFVALSVLLLDTARASLPYLKSWACGDDEALLAELSAVDRIAADLLRRIDAVA